MFIFLRFRGQSENECNKRLIKFSEMNAEFVKCSIQNAEPVNFCTACVDRFVNMTFTYKNLTTEIDGLNCKDFYIDLDRLSIVQTIYNQAWQLWEKGFCRECFNWNDTTFEQTHSNNTETFFNYLNTTVDCIHMNYGDACIKCSSYYVRLNDFYNSINKNKESKICFDIQDKMNKTRQFWSKEMSCCKQRHSNFTNFTILSSLFCLIPVVFYGGYYIYAIRIERRPFLLHNGKIMFKSGKSALYRK